MRLGTVGEQHAQKHLEGKGYKFIDRNFLTRWGELDLIMESGDGTVVFVEVKSRIESEVGSPLEQIDQDKMSHLKRAIEIYLYQRGWNERPARLDAVGITYEWLGDDMAVVKFEHIEDLTGW
jgi:putative endonuclease